MNFINDLEAIKLIQAGQDPLTVLVQFISFLGYNNLRREVEKRLINERSEASDKGKMAS